MTSIEDRLRDLGASVAPPPLPGPAAVMRRGRRRRLRRRGAGLAAVALVAAGGGLVARGFGADGGDAVRTTTPGPADQPDAPAGTVPGSTAPGVPGTVPLDPGGRAVPDVVGLTVAEARGAIESIGLGVSAAGLSDGAQVVSQAPAAGTALDIGGAVTLMTADLDRPAGVDGPVIRGTLLDGRPWTVGHSSQHGLCVTFGPTDLGCDDIGPAIPAGADPATPRVGADASGYDFPEEEAGALAYAYLPPGATTVELAHEDGRTVTAGLVVEPSERFWALPIQPGDVPDTAAYLDASGRELARFPLTQ